MPHTLPHTVEKGETTLEDLIAAKPDSILVGSIAERAVCPAFDKCTQAGIAMFTLDFETHCDSTVCKIYNDSWLAACAAARGAIEYAKENNRHLNVYVIAGFPGLSVSVLREGGFIETVAAEGPEWVSTLLSPYCDYVDAKAADAVMAGFPAHPELNGIWETACMSKGCIEGLRTIGRLHPAGDPEHVWVCGYCGFPEITAYLEEGLMDGFVVHSPIITTCTAVKVQFTYVLQGKPVPKYICTTGAYVKGEDVIGTPEWDDVWGNIIRWGEEVTTQNLVDWGVYEFTR